MPLFSAPGYRFPDETHFDELDWLLGLPQKWNHQVFPQEGARLETYSVAASRLMHLGISDCQEPFQHRSLFLGDLILFMCICCTLA